MYSGLTNTDSRVGKQLSHPAAKKRLSRIIATAILCALMSLVVRPAPALAHNGDPCGFFFCEPEAWLSNQNAIHFAGAYALQFTTTAINDSPWKNFFWLSLFGLGIETYQGAALEHPLHGGFSYKNVIFNEAGYLAGVVVYKLFIDDDRKNRYSDLAAPPGEVKSVGYAVLPMQQYLRPCRCDSAAGPVMRPSSSIASAGYAVIGPPGLHARYAARPGAVADTATTSPAGRPRALDRCGHILRHVPPTLR